MHCVWLVSGSHSGPCQHVTPAVTPQNHSPWQCWRAWITLQQVHRKQRESPTEVYLYQIILLVLIRIHTKGSHSTLRITQHNAFRNVPYSNLGGSLPKAEKALCEYAKLSVSSHIPLRDNFFSARITSFYNREQITPVRFTFAYTMWKSE